MKAILIVLSFFIFGFAFSQEIQFNKEVVDFGNIKKGVENESVVEIKNIGSTPLILTNVKSSCGCTVPEWPKNPILPGKTANITIKLTGDKEGAYSKVIEVFSNDKNSPRKLLRIKGQVN